METQYTERRLYEVCNQYGIHARPAALMVKVASLYDSEFELRKKGEDTITSGKSIMGLMVLEASKGTVLEITAIGSQTDARRYFTDIEELTDQVDSKKEERIFKCISEVFHLPRLTVLNKIEEDEVEYQPNIAM